MELDHTNFELFGINQYASTLTFSDELPKDVYFSWEYPYYENNNVVSKFEMCQKNMIIVKFYVIYNQS